MTDLMVRSKDNVSVSSLSITETWRCRLRITGNVDRSRETQEESRLSAWLAKQSREEQLTTAEAGAVSCGRELLTWAVNESSKIKFIFNFVKIKYLLYFSYNINIRRYELALKVLKKIKTISKK